MPLIRLPKLSRYELPAVCIVTGKTKGVVFRPVPFRLPNKGGRLAAGLLGGGALAWALVRASEETVTIKMPFTGRAYAAWMRGKKWFTLSTIAAVALVM